MCEEVLKKVLFSQARCIDPGNHARAFSTDWHYNETPHYAFVELSQYGLDIFIMETYANIEENSIHTRQLLPIGTRSFDAVRIAIINFDMYAKRVDAIANKVMASEVEL